MGKHSSDGLHAKDKGGFLHSGLNSHVELVTLSLPTFVPWVPFGGCTMGGRLTTRWPRPFMPGSVVSAPRRIAELVLQIIRHHKEARHFLRGLHGSP